MKENYLHSHYTLCSLNFIFQIAILNRQMKINKPFGNGVEEQEKP